MDLKILLEGFLNQHHDILLMANQHHAGQMQNHWVQMLMDLLLRRSGLMPLLLGCCCIWLATPDPTLPLQSINVADSLMILRSPMRQQLLGSAGTSREQEIKD
jgi:hypothetical protein